MPHREFTLDDFIGQMGQISKLGPMGKWVGMLPGMSEMVRWLGGDEEAERQLQRMRGIYDSMSHEERQAVGVLDGARRRRIARGAGVDVAHVQQFVRQFQGTRDMMQAVASGAKVRPLQKYKLVAGLVTDNPRRRDPSWLIPFPSRENWQGFLAVTVLIIAFAALIAAWARVL